MDAQLKAKWVEALRSGQYQQADSVLRRPHSEDVGFAYCCLGVLCHSMGADWKAGMPTLNGEVLEDENECLLGEPGLRLTGLDEKTQMKLSMMNDSGTPFPEIANFIEKNL